MFPLANEVLKEDKIYIEDLGDNNKYLEEDEENRKNEFFNDPDPNDEIIKDNRPWRDPSSRILKKAILLNRLYYKEKGNLDKLTLYVLSAYTKECLKIIEDHVTNALRRILKQYTHDFEVRSLSLDIFHMLVEKHDFDKSPNINIGTVVYKTIHYRGYIQSIYGKNLGVHENTYFFDNLTNSIENIPSEYKEFEEDEDEDEEEEFFKKDIFEYLNNQGCLDTNKISSFVYKKHKYINMVVKQLRNNIKHPNKADYFGRMFAIELKKKKEKKKERKEERYV